MTGLTTDGLVATVLQAQFDGVAPEIVEEVQAQSFNVAVSSVMHCAEGTDLA